MKPSVRLFLIALAGLACAVAMVLALAGVSGRIASESRAVLNGPVRQAGQARLLQVNLKKQVQEWKDVLLRGRDPALLARHRAQFEQARAAVGSSLEALRRSKTPTGVRNRLDQFAAARADLDHSYDVAYATFASGGGVDFATADLAVRGMDRPPTDLLDRIVADLEQSAAASADAARRHAAQRQRQAVVLGLSLITALFGLGTALGARFFTRLRQVARVAQQMADGDLAARADLTGKDEAAWLAARVNNLGENIEGLVSDLRHGALHDPLTGLPNRTPFQEALARALARRNRPGRGPALLVLDLDSFKSVNDTYGHATGDELLCAIATRLTRLARAGDLVARLGGDEFAVVVDDADIRAAVVLAERIIAGFSEPFTLTDVTVVSGASIGVYLATPQEPAEAVLARADAALYSAKAAGGGSELFDPDRHGQFLERYQLELELRDAPSRHELVLHYQPIVELATRRIVEVEALIRWNHPARGFLPPSAFLAIAEEGGAIVDIGRWVLRQACLDAKVWQEHIPGAEGIGVAVNVSRRQLCSPSISDDLADALSASGLAATHLTVEITETALVADADEVLATLHKFKALGVEVAMDDFGTGYSSLSQLRILPIDVVKIDKAFVDGIATSSEDWVLAAAIVRLAASLGKRTLAEGIEDAAQHAHLRALGCALGQGYYFARPVPLADLERLLLDRSTELGGGG